MSDKSVEALRKEFEYYLAHQNELVEKYNGKVIVIKNGAVIGVYDSDIEAITETAKEHELGTFLVQVCEPGPSSYRQTFHSRVAFA
jgi:nitrogenase molybdenum-iron protein alpha/beta subunit